jgi:hypothetical protein
MRTNLSSRAREQAVAAIIEARFRLSEFEKVRREEPEYWASARNDMARGIYGEALREKERLLRASDESIAAEQLSLSIAR